MYHVRLGRDDHTDRLAGRHGLAEVGQATQERCRGIGRVLQPVEQQQDTAGAEDLPAELVGLDPHLRRDVGAQIRGRIAALGPFAVGAEVDPQREQLPVLPGGRQALHSRRFARQ